MAAGKTYLVNPFKILPEEIQKAIEYRTSSDDIRTLSYRKLIWRMVDDNLTVYRILLIFKLLGKSFKEKDGLLKEYLNNYTLIWYTDIAYVILGGIHAGWITFFNWS